MVYFLWGISFILLMLLTIVFIDRRQRIGLRRQKEAIISKRPLHPFHELPDERIRVKLARRITRVFDLWCLSERDQAMLLGLPRGKEVLLLGYRKGRAIDEEQDLLGRVGHLLAIHGALRGIFHKNREQAYNWLTLENSQMEDRRPLDLMKEGYEGLLAVRHYLDFDRE